MTPTQGREGRPPKPSPLFTPPTCLPTPSVHFSASPPYPPPLPHSLLTLLLPLLLISLLPCPFLTRQIFLSFSPFFFPCILYSPFLPLYSILINRIQSLPAPPLPLGQRSSPLLFIFSLFSSFPSSITPFKDYSRHISPPLRPFSYPVISSSSSSFFPHHSLLSSLSPILTFFTYVCHCPVICLWYILLLLFFLVTSHTMEQDFISLLH